MVDQETKAVAAEQLEEIPIFLATATSVVSQLKNRLQQQYERAYPELGDIIRYVIDEEEANAWNLLSLAPHLFLPDLVEAHMARAEHCSDCFQQPKHSECYHVSRIDRFIKRNPDVTLRSQVVNLIRGNPLDQLL